MGTADAEMLSTQRFQALSLLRNVVHLEDCHAPYNTCEPVGSYHKRFRSLLLCLLLCECQMSTAADASFSFSLGGVSLSVGGSKEVGVRKDRLPKKCFDHLGLGGLRVAGKIIINSTENMLGIYYATKCTSRCLEWNITPKVSTRLPSVSSNYTSHSTKQ